MLKLNTSWKAVYSKSETLMQFNRDGSENSYVDIDRDRVKQFILYRNGKPAVIIHLEGKKKLIYRMRRAINNRGEEETVFLAGWQEKRNSMNIQMISFLFDDDHIEIVDRFNEEHSWFYSIRFLAEEKI